LLALFRILEATEGSIVIDGVDISEIGLRNCELKILGSVLSIKTNYFARVQCVVLFPLYHNPPIYSREPFERISTQWGHTRTWIFGRLLPRSG